MSGAALGQIQLEIDGEGQPIVFLHGLGASSSSFQPLLDSLGGFRCIRPDLPGAGRSSLPFAKITMESLVEVVRGHCHISPVKAHTRPFVSSLTHWIRSILLVLRSK
jgi:3-oxoadipate enol-lactonase